ncbi:phytoene desaturase family protein [Rubinisphaera brasiliensis]|uniref:Fumarate reductase/succinate dehydrogenase flavoprotein domain protein n=1 Tax=Rubinisphaera brasiliensis (strain ATCC 49424 / DSM 5305 / JCM 21570 / IAM 15109 / NBRC 103401 / IFAM 1448) TaxID=756272 RepID=F0SJW4_RUBBR|nr:FAD-dependent oxidoreductase [Rubinisphaera brasiliensis]ADY58653.1 fumarate reductase/succinate dehydrogenase flavoprotein domain protein [Rubinisphaera brasiliensis DSM 5305]
MAKDFLAGVQDSYDVIVIGSGLAGLTGANILAKQGYSVLLLEHHYQLGGMATWFKRRGGHIFDISLHGFPNGMVKSCRKYWTQEIADKIVQLKGVRFENPQFSLETTFNRVDFTNLLIDKFQVPAETVQSFFDTARGMNFYDDQGMTTRELFEKFFPGRDDVVRLLMEPITYANGSTLEDPAITYGIVFSNFMSKGVFTFQGGTDALVLQMKEELIRNGVDLRIRSLVEKIEVDAQRNVTGVIVNGKRIGCKAVLSNSNLKSTILNLVGAENFDREYVEEAEAVRMNNSSCQVYIALKPGESFDYCGDLLFHSEHRGFDIEAMLSKEISSRTFSFYYPETRPGSDRWLVVSSTNARYEDWANLSEEEYERDKKHLCETTVDCLAKYVPDIREKLDWVEASTPRTFQYYTRHLAGASFGTKFEGLKVSQELPQQISGLHHAGSVGIIMSGWLGAMNYGVIVSNEVDKYLTSAAATL